MTDTTINNALFVVVFEKEKRMVAVISVLLSFHFVIFFYPFS